MQRFSVRQMRISPEGISFIKSFEGLRLKAYRDGGGVLTIGYGHTAGVAPGQVITRTQAEDYFRSDIRLAEGVLRLGIKVPLQQQEYDALVSIVHNIGGGQFAGSTLRRLINELRYEDAADEFPRWVHDNGEIVEGLVRRRQMERQMFLTGKYGKA